MEAPHCGQAPTQGVLDHYVAHTSCITSANTYIFAIFISAMFAPLGKLVSSLISHFYKHVFEHTSRYTEHEGQLPTCDCSSAKVPL